ncbi:MAG: PAS domain S-box protein [Syntrophaceae bacterium]|nr:PAS domain S-box protein [Syntrophaceae bacterium]
MFGGMEDGDCRFDAYPVNEGILMTHLDGKKNESAEEIAALKRRIRELEKADEDRRLAENALRESEERFRTLVEHASDIVFRTDTRGYFTFINPETLRVAGYSEEEIVGMPFSALIRPDALDRVTRHFGIQYVKEISNTYLEYPIVRKDGRDLWLGQNTQLLFQEGEAIAFQAVARDITDRRHAEDALRDSERQYRLLAENSTDVIWTMTLDGRFTYVSPSVKALSGYTPEEVMEIPFHQYVVESYVEPAMTELAAQLAMSPADRARSMTLEIQQYCKDGSVKDIEITACWLFDENGNPVGVQGSTRDITDRKKIEEQYRILAELFELSPLAIAVHDLEGRFLYANQRLLELHGYTREESEGLRVQMLDTPESAALIEDRVREVMTTGEARFDVEHLRRDGTRFPMEAIAKAAKWGGKDVVLSVATDITERKRMEEALRENEEQYRLVVENAEEAISIAQEGRHCFINRRAVEIIGRPREEILDTPFLDYVHPDDRKMIAERYRKRMKDEHVPSVYTFRLLAGNGSVKWIEIHVTPISWLGQPATLNFFNDITDRKQAEDALRESETRYQAFFETTGATMLIVEDDMTISLANKRFEGLTGYRREEVEGNRKWTEFVEKEDLENMVARHRLRRTNSDDVEKSYEFRLRHRDGSVKHILLTVGLIPGTKQSVASLIDITDQRNADEERRRLEERLQHADKMEAIGTLAGGIAHDFNNLLMGIQGYASLTLLDLDPSHPHYERLKRIEEQVQSGTDLTRQLLGFARGGRYEVKPTDMNEIVKKTSSMFGRTKKEIAVHRKYDRKLWSVEAERGQMEQIFMNLYVNAWQAMPGGGEIFLATENVIVDEADAQLLSVIPGKYVKITITDTGTGMDAKTRERIFDPFFTTKAMGRGTGLGLAMVYGIVKGHGGMIHVESEPGLGSTFTILLPASEKEVVTEARESGTIAKGKETILLVDDEGTVAEVTGELLTSLGYSVYKVGSGQEAIAVYTMKRKEIDLVILDMIMPGLSGGETFDRLKEIDPEVKVLLSSGYSIDGEAKTIMERGCNGFLQKPFHLEQLSSKLREVLD